MRARPGRNARPPLLVVAGLVVGGLTVLGGPPPAAADPAGPTDYRSEIVAVDPPTPQIELEILGGDSFVELAAEPGTDVRVTGYRGEPYLWFDADGTVFQNDRSPSRWLNDDRFGEADIPATADAEAEPEWVAVADDGVFAWHDHRAHWMNPSRPIGATPGDVILEAVIPLTVDGDEVLVEVRSTLLASPSPLAAGLGGVGVLAAGVGLLGWWRPRTGAETGSPGRTAGARSEPILALVAVVGAAATASGAAAVLGLPAEAAPGPVRWLLPLVATVVSLAALYLGRGGRLAPPIAALVAPAALALAGVELLAWVWLRRTALDRALIPSAAPAWLDRLVVAGAAAAGLVALAAAVITIRERRPVPRPTR